MPLHFDTIPRTPSNSRKRSRRSISQSNSVKKRRISLASVDLSGEIPSGICPEFREETSADRFVPARPKGILPLNITPRTNRIARMFGLADERLLNFSDRATATEVNMFTLLRKNASQLFQTAPAARSTSVVSNLGVRKQFLLALDGPGVPISASAYPMAWSTTNSIAVASRNDIYYQNLEDRTISHLCRLNGTEYGMLHGIEWGGKEMQNILALGTAAGTVQIWDASVSRHSNTARALRSWKNYEASCIGGMNWHGSKLAVGGSSDISIFDVREKSEMRRVKGHSGQVDGVKFSHDGNYIVSGDENGGVFIWDTRAWKPLLDESRRGRLDHNGPVKSLAWCPWKPDLVATGSMFPEGKIRVWSTNAFTTSSPIHMIPLNTSITSLHWSPHCQEILSTHGSSWAPPTTAALLRRVPKFTQVPSPLTNSITVHSYPTFMRLVSVSAHTGTVRHSCLSPDGTMVFTICPKEESMKMWKVWGRREDVDKQESVFDKYTIR